jgi:hypothetical protein
MSSSVILTGGRTGVFYGRRFQPLSRKYVALFFFLFPSAKGLRGIKNPSQSPFMKGRGVIQ